MKISNSITAFINKLFGIIPFKKNALVWLDGKIIDISGTKYFRDKISGYHFEIHNYDFPDNWKKGFWIKSKAYITAPSGVLDLINADVNNYLYSSGGVPNNIMIHSLFGNIDFENKIYCRETIHKTFNEVEFKEGYISDLTIYSSNLTTDENLKAQKYFGFETEQTTLVKWFSPTGNDSNAGTKISPYKTYSKASSISGITKIYAKTGLYDYETYFDVIKGLTVQGTGNCIIDTTGASYSIYIHKATVSQTLIFKNFKIVGSYSCIYLGTNNTNNYFEKVYFFGSTTKDIWNAAGNTINLKHCIVSNRIYYAGGIVADQSNIYEIVGNLDSNGLVMKNCFYSGNSFTMASNGSVNIFGLHSKTATFIFNSNTSIPEFHHNNIYKRLTTGSHVINAATKMKIYNNTFTCLDFVTGYAVINEDKKGSEIFNNLFDTYSVNQYSDILVNGDTATNSYPEIYGNKVKHKGLIGYGIKIGIESGSDKLLIHAKVYNNVVLGASYFDSNMLPSDSSAHMIFFGNVENFECYNNYCNGGSPGIAIKGNGSHDLINALCYSNVCKDNNNNFLAQGVKNFKFVNCTSIQNKNILRHFSFGEAVDGICINVGLKNSIAYGLSNSTFALSIAVGSESGFTSDYNCIFTPNKTTIVNHGSLGQLSFSGWQTAGFDLHSINQDPQLTNFIPDDNSPVLNAGENLGTDYEIGFDENTNFGGDDSLPVIVLKTQSGANWDMGAFVINKTE